MIIYLILSKNIDSISVLFTEEDIIFLMFNLYGFLIDRFNLWKLLSIAMFLYWTRIIIKGKYFFSKNLLIILNNTKIHLYHSLFFNFVMEINLKNFVFSIFKNYKNELMIYLIESLFIKEDFYWWK